MAETYIPIAVRRAVVARSGGACEYCRIAETDTFFGCQVDHIVAQKHGGQTVAENLAYACAVCNQAKGSDLGSLDPATGELVRFYNPRADVWADHFRHDDPQIESLTAIGRVTAVIFGFNRPERLLERSILLATGRYPPTDM